jgi:hypothetical protein
MTKRTSMRNGALIAVSFAALAMPAHADHGRDTHRGGYGGGAVLHVNNGFGGDAIGVDGAIPDLSRVRFNDRASSISIQSGVWELCSDANFRGKCATIDTSVARLSGLQLNDNVSSIRPAGYGRRDDRGWNQALRGNAAAVVLFSNGNQRGDPIEISGDVADLTAYRFNDRASSILVTRGTWLVCEHANYRGRCEVVSQGSGDLRPIGMNDNISSIRRYDIRYEARRDDDRYERRY